MSSRDGDAQARSMADAVARRSYGKLVAFLAARTRDVAAAEDALSEAFASALADWPRNGCPSNPEAWLLTVARRKIIDVARRRGKGEAATGQVQLLAEGLDAAAADVEIPDRRLALMFACAHPAIEAGVRAVDASGGGRVGCEDDRLGVPHVSGGHRQATRPGQEQDPAGWHSARHPGARGASRPARHRVGRHLRRLRRRLDRPGRDRCRPSRSHRGSVLFGQARGRAAAGGTGGPGPACPHASALTGSPVVAVNRALALAELQGARRALEAMPEAAADVRLAEYQPYWAARAELLARTGANGEARRAYGIAIGLERDPAVRRFLQRRQSALPA